MRILRIADVPDNRTGGMSRAMYCTGDVLKEWGHEVEYIFRDQLPSRVPQQLRRFRIPLKLPGLVRRLSGERRFDVVEIHEPLAAAYCLERDFGMDLPPVAVFSHGLEENGNAAELAYKRSAGITVSLKNRLSPLSVVWQAVFSTRHADHVICTNVSDARHLISRGVLPARVTVQHNGVDRDFLSYGEIIGAPDSVAARPLDILFLGSWILRKGIREVVAAMKEVWQRHPRVRLTVAGCGVDREIIFAAFPVELRPRLEVIPRVDAPRELLSVYARHSILLLPSFYEGHPLVMVEAAAMRMAIVTTGICGMLDFIRDGENGRLVRVGDSRQIADVVSELVGDAAQRARLGSAAFETAKHHTWTAAARQILAAYEGAAAAQPANGYFKKVRYWLAPPR